MKVLSINVGLPRLVEADGEPVLTGIYKAPVSGKIKVGEFNLEGDRQADLSVHGGYAKAVYAYPSEHYAFWQAELPEMELPFGVFGENLSVEGILETDVGAGDRLQIGTARFIITTPRYPCFKLGIRFDRKDILRRFAKSGRSGFYLAVEKTGEIETGDRIEFLSREIGQASISEIFRERLRR